MKEDSAQSEFDLKFRLRMTAKLAKWLAWLVAGGSVAAAAAHLLQ